MFLCCVCSRLVKIVISLATSLMIIAVIVLLVLRPWARENCVGCEATVFPRAVVVSNGVECAQIGHDILAQDGSATDALIATLFCEGISCPQSMGLGGGFLAMHYTRDTGEVSALDAREVAPAATTHDMFEGGVSSVVGGAAVAVPGELRGYGELYNRYGKLPWHTLIAPTIELCLNGHKVSDYLGRVMRNYNETIMNEPSLRDEFVNPLTGQVYVAGDIIKRPKLAETLAIIAGEGPDALNNGTLTQSFVDDITSFGGIITVDDMINYRPIWRQPVVADLDGDMTLNTMPLPGSGPILAFILQMMGFSQDESAELEWHRIIETFKYAYAMRTNLGDPDNELYGAASAELAYNLSRREWAEYYQAEIDDERTYNEFAHYGGHFSMIDDQGTAHVCVIAPNGDAASATSTINYIFGALRVSPSTGIVLNNEMDDFAIPGRNNSYGIPPSPANYLNPGLRPLSSMAPSIIVGEDGEVKLVAGAAGGTKITTQVALVIKKFLDSIPLDQAMNDPRVHHQLMPMYIQYEAGFDESILASLRSKGHETELLDPTAGFAAVTAAARVTGGYVGSSDKRRPGSVAGF